MSDSTSPVMEPSEEPELYKMYKYIDGGLVDYQDAIARIHEKANLLLPFDLKPIEEIGDQLPDGIVGGLARLSNRLYRQNCHLSQLARHLEKII